MSHTVTPTTQNLSIPPQPTTGTNLFPNNVFLSTNTNNSNDNNNSNDPLQIHSSQPLIPSTPPSNPFSGFMCPSPKSDGSVGIHNLLNPATPPTLNMNVNGAPNIDNNERWDNNNELMTSGHEDIIGAWQTMFTSNCNPSQQPLSSNNGSPGFHFNPHGMISYIYICVQVQLIPSHEFVLAIYIYIIQK